MKALMILGFFLMVLATSAQNVTDAEQAKIVDEQVWEPFKKAYYKRDAVAFNDIHTEDVMRITSRGFQIGEVYRNANIHWLNGNTDRPKRTIDFVFEHRIYSDGVAYEIGYYKISTPSDPARNPSYSRFSILLRKVNGSWKIAQDWDVNVIGGRKVTEEDFNRLLPD